MGVALMRIYDRCLVELFDVASNEVLQDEKRQLTDSESDLVAVKVLREIHNDPERQCSTEEIEEIKKEFLDELADGLFIDALDGDEEAQNFLRETLGTRDLDS